MEPRGLAETLADQWVLLFSSSCNKPISDPEFRKRYDDIDKQYRELPNHQKTIFNRIIHRGIKDVVDTLLGEANAKASKTQISNPRKPHETITV